MTTPPFVRAETLPEALFRHLDRGGELRFELDREQYSIAELALAARRLATRIARSVPEQGRVGVMARNGHTALISWWACTLAGRVLVPFNTGVRGAILDHQIADADLSLVIVEAEFCPAIDDALRATGLRVPALIDGDGVLPATSTEPFTKSYVELEPLPLVAPDPFAISHLVYTSGTTGPSKACVVSHAYLGNLGKHMRENLERERGEKLWTANPLFHLAAIGHVIGSLQLDAEIAVARRFSVTRFWEDVVSSGARVAALMGSMLALVLKADENEWTARGHGQLRAVSGAPVSAELSAAWSEKFGVPRVGSAAYGMTEASLIASSPAGGVRPGSAGRPNDDFEVAIVDENGYRLPDGASGEVVCRPKVPGIMFDGYWGQPERTLETYRGLWFHTGDLGRLDDGYLYFVDRKKDCMRRGGENISSAEIEAVALQHGDVLEVAVHAVPSPLGEDDVKVTCVLRDGAAVSELELFEWLLPKVPRFAAPSHVEFRSQLPRNAVGRVLKHQLRDEGVTVATVETNWRARV
ncbi:AMP-binding protein [Nocardioides sp. Bht2]|uniref:AMP-binding protein n=1 Tax=Nocardioides sp. Bht2 TaxID=3392297 RepID=UPI0039B535BB